MDTAPSCWQRNIVSAGKKSKSESEAAVSFFNPMKSIFKVALATIALAGTSGAAHADLNYNGEVGLPINPTAQIPSTTGGFRLQGNYYDLGGADLYSIGGAARASKTSPIEVNGAVNYLDGGGNDVRFSIGAKYLFTRETDPAGVRIAAGAGYSQYSDLKNARAYVVASKSFGNPVEGKASITGHLGARYDNYDGTGSSSNKFSGFAGVEVPVTSKGDFQVVGEIGSKVADGGKFPYSAGIRYRANQQPFGATVGVQRLGISGNNDPKIFVQLGYTFGG